MQGVYGGADALDSIHLRGIYVLRPLALLPTALAATVSAAISSTALAATVSAAISSTALTTALARKPHRCMRHVLCPVEWVVHRWHHRR